jgi:hypothetical protein
MFNKINIVLDWILVYVLSIIENTTGATPENIRFCLEIRIVYQ